MFGCFPNFWSSDETPVSSTFQDTVGMKHRQDLAQVAKTLRVLGSRLESENEASRTSYFQCRSHCETACKTGDIAFASSKTTEMVKFNARVKCIKALLRVFGETQKIVEDEHHPPQTTEEIEIALEGFVEAITKTERKLKVAKLATLESIYKNLDAQEHPMFMKLLSKRPAHAIITEQEREAFNATVKKKATQELELIQGPRRVIEKDSTKKD